MRTKEINNVVNQHPDSSRTQNNIGKSNVWLLGLIHEQVTAGYNLRDKTGLFHHFNLEPLICMENKSTMTS